MPERLCAESVCGMRKNHWYHDVRNLDRHDFKPADRAPSDPKTDPLCRHPRALISPSKWNTHRGLIMCPDCGCWCSPSCGKATPKPVAAPCKYGDPACPCNDGDSCNYE